MVHRPTFCLLLLLNFLVIRDTSIPEMVHLCSKPIVTRALATKQFHSRHFKWLHIEIHIHICEWWHTQTHNRTSEHVQCARIIFKWTPSAQAKVEIGGPRYAWGFISPQKLCLLFVIIQVSFSESAAEAIATHSERSNMELQYKKYIPVAVAGFYSYLQRLGCKHPNACILWWLGTFGK